MRTRKVLIVEDEHALALALSTVVVRAGAEAVKVASGAAALEELAATDFNLVILDIGLPDMSGLDVLRKAFPESDGKLPIPVLVITAHGSLDNAIAARKLGAADYLVKPLDLPAFQQALAALLKSSSRGETEAAEEETSQEKTSSDEIETTLIGGAPAMQSVFREIAHACSVKMPVVISGATGTGKSLAARVIHVNGEHTSGEILSINDEAGPGDTLLVEQVDGLDADAQAELVKVLESEDGPRVIATSRTPLHDAVTAGDFREDLYYRLNVLEIKLPDLADRREDLPALAQYFLGRSASDRAISFSAEAMQLLQKHSWPGNVLELRNAIGYAVGVCGGAQILPQHLPANVVLDVPFTGGNNLDSSLRAWIEGQFEQKEDDLKYGDLIGELEGKLLRELLRRYDEKPTRLAAALGMNRTTLRKKCAELLREGE